MTSEFFVLLVIAASTAHGFLGDGYDDACDADLEDDLPVYQSPLLDPDIAQDLSVYESPSHPSGLSDCSINIARDLPENEPLLLQPDGASDVTQFLQPNDAGLINLRQGEKVVLACPGPDNMFPALGGYMSEVNATCVQGRVFDVYSRHYNISDLRCRFKLTSKAVATNKKCAGDHTVIYIGFELYLRFIKTIEVCFDDELLGPVYTNTTIVAGIAGRKKRVKRPDFKPAGFYGNVSPEERFKKAEQFETFTVLLGSYIQARKYIQPNTNYFLARGHLTAMSDFVFADQQKATFFYVNAAPQWQVVNCQNWNDLEDSVQRKVTTEGVEFQVYTGTHGIATLPHFNGHETPLYLDLSKKLPVPQFYWKVVYEPKKKAGVAFIALNNPYVTLANKPNLRLCPDVCSDIKWVTWRPDETQRGEGYCCKVDDLRQAIPTIPELEVNSLLV